MGFALCGILPKDMKEATFLKRRANQFFYDAATKQLYHRSYDGILLRCYPTEKHRLHYKKPIMTCGAHQPGPKPWDRIRRMGYHWLKMVIDTIVYVKNYHACQIHADYVHQLSEYLNSTTALKHGVSMCQTYHPSLLKMSFVHPHNRQLLF